MKNNTNRRELVLATIAGVIAASLAPTLASAQAMDPAARRIQSYYATLLPAVLQSHSVADRARRISPAVNGTFDMATMVRVAIGPAWSRFSGSQQAAVREAFAAFTVADYASQLDAYTGENSAVNPVSEPRGSDRLVKTTIGSTTINYLVRGSRIVDVYANGTVSELANRRAEFSSILESGTPEQLIQTLRERTRRLLNGNA